MTAVGETVHSFEHVERVLRTAAFLAEQEKADLELVQIGALLHDIGWVVGQPHHENGAELADEILKEMDYPEERREKVVKIVLHHDLDFRDKLETLEERIVWDADKIDILGILGIVRTFHWLGKSSFVSVIRGAFEKLTAIHPQLNTKTAKAIAEERHKQTLTLLAALKEELSLRDLRLFSRSSSQRAESTKEYPDSCYH